MTEAQLAAEFARLNEQITALVGHIANIEAVVCFDDRAKRTRHYHALMEASEKNDDGIRWGGKDLRIVSDRTGPSETGLEALGLTADQLAEAQKKLGVARVREILGQQVQAARTMKRSKKRGK